MDDFDCPHAPDGNIARCPLYIESHVGRGFGCIDDMALRCMVVRGEMNFQTAIIELAANGIAHPGMIQALHTVGGVQ